MTADTIEAIVREMRENGSNPFATGVILTSYCKDWAERLEAIASQQGGEVVAWEHGLTVEGCRMPQLSYDEDHPFGEYGVSHGGTVDSIPLYSYPSPGVFFDEAMVLRLDAYLWREHGVAFGKTALRDALTSALEQPTAEGDAK